MSDTRLGKAVQEFTAAVRERFPEAGFVGFKGDVQDSRRGDGSPLGFPHITILLRMKSVAWDDDGKSIDRDEEAVITITSDSDGRDKVSVEKGPFGPPGGKQ